MDTSPESAALLNRVLVPLMDPEEALSFLRRAAPAVVQTMEAEVVGAAREQITQTLARVASLRDTVRQAANEHALRLVTDVVLLPQALLDPDDPIWQQWGRGDLCQKLRHAQNAVVRTESLLQNTPTTDLQYHPLRERLQRDRRGLLEVEREILLSWLQQKEEELQHQYRGQAEVGWQVRTRLQVPVVTGNQVVDFVDAEVDVLATAPEAFVTRTFAVLVIPGTMGVVPALRRINTISHFLPPETILVVVTTTREHLPIFRQHNLYVYFLEEEGGE